MISRQQKTESFEVFYCSRENHFFFESAC